MRDLRTLCSLAVPILPIAASLLIHGAALSAQETPPGGAAAPEANRAGGEDAALPGSLTEAIATALRTNPDVQLAEAKVRAATAELNRVRLEVVREITAAYAEVRWQREARKTAEQLFALAKHQNGLGHASIDAVVSAQETVARAASALAKAEAKFPYLLGSGAGAVEVNPPESAVPAGAAPGATVEREPSARERELLNTLDSTPTEFAFEAVPLAEVLGAISDVTGLAFVVSYNVDIEAEVTLRMHAPLRHFLLGLADQNDELAFVVRDYGILVTTVEHARRLGGPTFPSRPARR